MNLLNTTKGRILIGLLLIAILLSGAFIVSGKNESDIQQPINFLHQTHVALNEIPCEFCHIYARRSRVSGVPPVGVCAGCHLHIKGTVAPQYNEIRKIIDLHWKKDKPIAWKKVHDLPDFINFSHEMHIKAGFDCTDCHGDLMKVKTPIPFSINNEIPQSMGWCISCHDQAHPTYKSKVIGPVKETRGSPDSIESTLTADGTLKGNRDCIVCHK